MLGMSEIDRFRAPQVDSETLNLFGKNALACRELGHRISGVWLRNVGCLARDAGCLARLVGCLARNVGCLARNVGCLARNVGCLAPLLGKSPHGVTVVL